jgi:chemotaxis protein MotB
MAKKCPKCECPAGEKWAVPFADFLSLLLALFIALYALASVNKEKQKALKDEFVKIYEFNTESDTMKEEDKSEKSKTDEENDAEILGKEGSVGDAFSRLNELEKDIKEGGNLLENEKGTFMALPAQLLFESGKAELTSKYAPIFLSRLAKLISTMPNDTEINVRGFAEDVEIKNSKYRDALDLSSARANNVVRELIKNNIPANKIYSSGFGSTKSDQLIEKKAVEFELRTSRELKNEEEVDFESILKRVE